MCRASAESRLPQMRRVPLVPVARVSPLHDLSPYLAAGASARERAVSLVGTRNPYGITTEDLRRLERRRANLERQLSLKRQARERELKHFDDIIETVEADLADTEAELAEKTEEWELLHGGSE